MSDISNTKSSPAPDSNSESRHVVIYGYTAEDLAGIMRQFKMQLPDYININISTSHLVTHISLIGTGPGKEFLRFKMNRYQQNLQDLFPEEVVAVEDKSITQVLSELLRERELTVASAESCTGGNIAHRITSISGSSAYFLGSVVSYSNDVKAKVLGVSRSDIDRFGAVSRPVAEQMALGVSKLMQSDCAMATTGIAGPDGGTKYKPVGTVWIAVKYNDRVVSELIHFDGDRNAVIESATNHAMVMLIKLLRNNYSVQEEINDD